MLRFVHATPCDSCARSVEKTCVKWFVVGQNESQNCVLHAVCQLKIHKRAGIRE